MTERQLIKRCCQHDRVAQQKLYETYAPKMLGICMRYVKDYHVACDLMHDGFITVYSKIGDSVRKALLKDGCAVFSSIPHWDTCARQMC